MAAEAEHPRLILPRFLSLDLCKELVFIHKSCGAVGYRPGVLSTTLPHLVATGCGHLLLPFVAVRERLKEKVEESFGCEFELFVEFTGLVSWCKGASIGWHSDDNQPYLKQRDFTAVCYLNDHGTAFKGGVFRFQDGEPSSIIPAAGDVVIYTADKRNVHSVEEVTAGERITLTLWFTRDNAYDEDAKLLTLLLQASLNHEEGQNSHMPLPASDNMYWFSQGGSGFDLRCARAHALGYIFYSTDDLNSSTSISSVDPFDSLAKPLQIGRGDEIYKKTFVNSLHALQVVQYCSWKAPELATMEEEIVRSKDLARSSAFKKSSGTALPIPCDHKLAEAIFGYKSHEDAEFSFEWDRLELAVARWESYIFELHRDLLILMPYWVSNQALHHVSLVEQLGSMLLDHELRIEKNDEG